MRHFDRRLIAPLMMAGFLAFYTHDATKQARHDSIGRAYEVCVAQEQVREQANRRFGAQRVFLLAYESVVANRAKLDVKINKSLAKSDLQLIRAADDFRLATTNYPPLNCKR